MSGIDEERARDRPIQEYRRRYHDVVNTAAKLLGAIQRNPKQVRFDDACKAAGLLGFVRQGGQGSHRAFARPAEPMLLNFQPKNSS